MVENEKERKPKVAFASHAFENIDFDVHLNHMYAAAHWTLMYELFFLGKKGLQAADARNLLADLAIAQGCEYLFILDADHLITSNTLPLLMESKQEAMVSGLICKRQYPYPQVVWLKSLDGKYITVELPMDGTLAEVGVCPFGCTLINIAKLKKLQKPYFRDTCKPSTITGELKNFRSDINLSEAFREAGEKVWVDQRVLVGHLGSKKVVYPQNAEYLRASDQIFEKMTLLREGMSGDHAGLSGVTK